MEGVGRERDEPDRQSFRALGRSAIANWKNTPIRLQFFFRGFRTPPPGKNFKPVAYDGKYIRRGRVGGLAGGWDGCETNIEPAIVSESF